MGGEVRYCTTEDGVRIAYTVEGEGPPLLAMPFFLESFSLDHVAPHFGQILRRVARDHQLIRFDTRGTGLSERNVPDMSAESIRRDAEAVVRALGLKKLAVSGSSIGGLRALDFAARHPRSLSRLILWSTFSRVTDVFPPEMLQGFASLARANWELGARTIADVGIRRQSEELGLQLAQLYLQSTTGEVVAMLIEANVDLDLSPLLSRIRTPTFILYGMGDPLYPIAVGQKLAAAIPNARFLPLPGITSAIFFDDAAADIGNAFLKGEDVIATQTAPTPADTASALRTVLFTDIVGHTEMMRRLGDERGREVLREHERITREVLKAHGGTEVKTTGDGFMASFGSVTKAAECAIALQRAFAERNESAAEPLSIRVGLNAGEPIEEEGDLFGSTVILAARIADRADGSEILASMAVRELCAGKGFLFSDRGEHVLRGFEDPVRMFEISWRTTG